MITLGVSSGIISQVIPQTGNHLGIPSGITPEIPSLISPTFPLDPLGNFRRDRRDYFKNRL